MNQSTSQDYQNLYQPGQEPPKKNHTGCIIALVVVLVLFLIFAVLAAILIPAMLGYVRKSYTQKANVAAKHCANAGMAAIFDMDTENIMRQGTYIVTNIPGKEDLNAPYDTAGLHYAFDRYFAETEDGAYTYFFVVEGDKVTYAAVCSDEHQNVIGTFPTYSEPREAVTYSGESREVKGYDLTPFLELYEDACRSVPLPGSTVKEENLI